MRHSGHGSYIKNCTIHACRRPSAGAATLFRARQSSQQRHVCVPHCQQKSMRSDDRLACMVPGHSEAGSHHLQGWRNASSASQCTPHLSYNLFRRSVRLLLCVHEPGSRGCPVAANCTLWVFGPLAAEALHALAFSLTVTHAVWYVPGMLCRMAPDHTSDPATSLLSLQASS